MTPTDTRNQDIVRSLKRCNEACVEAALRFQTSHDSGDLALIIEGVLARDLPDTHITALATATDDTRLVEDLGMDSFGMMEVVMTAEEVFAISVANQELRDVNTLGKLKAFLLTKVRSSTTPDEASSAAEPALQS